MSLFWAVPPVAVVMATLVALVQLRGIAEAAADLRLELARLGEVQGAVAEVRAASSGIRATAHGLRRA
jgi:hypothetical protein